MSWKLRAALVCALTLALGCGYRFTAGGAPLPEGIRTVCVPLYANRTAEPALEVAFTSAMRDWTVRAGTAGGKECDATLEGEILSLAGGPGIAVGPTATLASYRVSAALRLRLLKGGRPVSLVDVAAYEDYLPARPPTGVTGPEGDPLDTEANRKAAVYRLAQTLARDGYERIASGW